MNKKEFIEKMTEAIDPGYHYDRDDLGSLLNETIQFGRDNSDTCEWILEKSDPNYYTCDMCGFQFVFMDGTPRENRFHYCPGYKCGKKINHKT